CGRLAEDNDRHPDEDTIFEIGSITKVFTGLLLAEMVERGLVKLDDPIQKYLPVPVPQEITLLHLATHTSGLPCDPPGWKPRNNNNPFADYGTKELYAFLSSWRLEREIGTRYSYSNLGMGLLGHLLSLRVNMSFEDLVTRRICDPLGMDDTRIHLS